MELELARTAWFAGDAFSAEDIQMSFPLEAAAARGGFDAAQPYPMWFLQRIQARAACRHAIKRDGRYALLK